MVYCVQESEDEQLISSDIKKGYPDSKSRGSSASIRTSIFQADGNEMDNSDDEKKGNCGVISKIYGFMLEKNRRKQNSISFI